LSKAAGELEALRAQLHGHKEQVKAVIFAAHSELLEDPDLIEIATSAIAKGKDVRSISTYQRIIKDYLY
jgi:multiphosphoryl transfer protein